MAQIQGLRDVAICLVMQLIEKSVTFTGTFCRSDGGLKSCFTSRCLLWQRPIKRLEAYGGLWSWFYSKWNINSKTC